MSITLAKAIQSGSCRPVNGDVRVYGDDTNWLANVEPGFIMFIASRFYQVDKVIAADELVLTSPFVEFEFDGLVEQDEDGTLHYLYQIVPTHAYSLDVNTKLDELVRKLDEQVLNLPVPADNSVSNAQLTNMPPSTIKARYAGSTGDPQDITPTQLAQMLENAGFSFATGTEAEGTFVPNGGQTGNVLVKNSNLSGDAAWKPLSGLIGATGTESYRGPWGLFLETVRLDFDQNYIPDYIETNVQATPLKVVLDPDSVNGSSKALTFPIGGNGANSEAVWNVYADEHMDSLRVRYKVQSEPGYDPFVIYIDGVEVFRDSGYYQLWKEHIVTLPHGPHLVKFAFYSDGSASNGYQNVRWSKIEFPRQRTDLGYNYGDTVNFNGSIWFCLKAGTVAEPGSNNDWKAFGGAGSGGSGGSGELIFSSDETGADTFTMNELHIGSGIDSSYASGKVSLSAIPPQIGKRGANGSDTVAGDGRSIFFQGDIVTTSMDGGKAIVTITTPHDLPTGGTPGQVLFKIGPADRQAGWGNLPLNPILVGGTTRQVLVKTSNSDGALAWTTLREPPSGGSTGQRLAKTNATDGAFSWVDPEIPAGGAIGKILGKISATDRHVGWIDPPSSIPNGGNTRDALVKASNANGDVTFAKLRELPIGGTAGQRLIKGDNLPEGQTLWADPEIPAGGTTMQALRKTSNIDRAYNWYDVHEVPAGGAVNDVLTKTGSPDYQYDWRPNIKIKRYLDPFTASGTWTKRPGAFKVRVTGIGAGGAGRGGDAGNNAANRAGGAGGSGGSFNLTEFAASDLPTTVAVTIAAKALGTVGAINPVSPPGQATAANPSNPQYLPNNGATSTAPTNPGNSSFGDIMVFKGGYSAGATAQQDAFTTYPVGVANTAGTQFATGAATPSAGTAGGGAGGGLTFSNSAQYNPQVGAVVTTTNTSTAYGSTGTVPRLSTIVAGGTPYTLQNGQPAPSSLDLNQKNGKNGYDVMPDRAFQPGAGGSGGASVSNFNTTNAGFDIGTIGGSGGHGGYGAGGGGGGAGTQQGGRGGDGGPSIIWVETWTEE